MTARRRSKRKSSKRKKRKSSKKRGVSLVSFVKKLLSSVKVLLILVTFFVGGLAAVWWLLPNIVSIQHSQDLVLYAAQETEQGSEIKKLYYVVFNTDLNKVALQQIDLSSSVNFYSENKKQEKELQQWWQQSAAADRVEESRFFTWVFQQPVEQVEILPNTEDLSEKKFITYLKNKVFQSNVSLKERFFWLRLYCFAKNNNIEIKESLLLTKIKLWQKNQDKQCATAVLNTTSISGLAGTIAEIIENAGLKVIRVDNPSVEPEELEDKTVVLINEETLVCSNKKSSLRKILGQDIVFRTKAESDDYWFERYRADVVVLLSQDQSF